jgi:hypothetical protein
VIELWATLETYSHDTETDNDGKELYSHDTMTYSYGLYIKYE